MAIIRLLNNGAWSKPPVLTAARKVFMDGLARTFPLRPLGELAGFVNGTSYDVGLLTENGTPIIRISNISDPRSAYLSTEERFADQFMVEPGDLLVSWSASFKSVIWSGPVGVLNQHIFKVTEKPGNHRGFIRHAIEAAFDEMQQKVVGIGMMHLRRGDFLGHLVAAPDLQTQQDVCRFLDWLAAPTGPEPALPSELSEQRRIVARIGELAAKIEEARGLRREGADQITALQVAARRKLFRPPVGESWRFLPVEEACDAIIDYRGRTPPISDSGIPHITSSNIRDGRIDWNTRKFVSEGTYQSYMTRGLPKPGDVIFTMEAPLGEAAVIPDDRRFSLAQRTLLLRAAQGVIEGPFLAAVLTSPTVREIIFAQATGTTVKGIASKRLKLIPLPIPPLREQRLILSCLDDLQMKVDALKRMQFEAATELDVLLPSVLDMAFRGEL